MTPRVQQYAEQEAAVTGVTVDDIMSRERRHVVAYARRRVAVRLRNDGFTYAQIAKWLGLNHSTVVYYMQGAAAPAQASAA